MTTRPSADQARHEGQMRLAVRVDLGDRREVLALDDGQRRDRAHARKSTGFRRCAGSLLRRPHRVLASRAMSTRTAADLAAADRAVLWHPFTQQQGWSDEDAARHRARRGLRRVWDTDGNAYIDGVSSLWCNVHGHRHPRIDAAVREQLDRVAHTTMLGLSHPPARSSWPSASSTSRPTGLSRVFYSDNGSTAIEIALKMAYQYHHQRGERWRSGFVCLREQLPRRHARLGLGRRHRAVPLALPAAAVRHPPGRARRRRPPSSALLAEHGERIAAVIVEPLVQGAAGMLVHPAGYLRAVRELCDALRRLPHLRRGRDRLRAHRDDVRLRAGGRDARLPVRRQGPHRRLPAARRDAHHRARLRGLPRRARASSAPSSTATPTPATRSPARPRSRRSTSSRRSARSSACSRRSRCSRQLLERARRAAARACARSAARGFMTGIELTGLPGRGRAWATASRSRRASAARSSARSATSSC